ncbi:MAG: hypothetical protein KF689_01975 [Gemmatimonadaceae bacterium]|nr:hypothetical protein [Gemmatimonadaceae bacterium]MCW5826699.1 hypothetical protein [Gemmatimonadaceae bacterium]
MRRRGIALPAVLLVLVALAMLSSLALGDAFAAARMAALAEDAAVARATASRGVAAVREPPDVPWLCLQPPTASVRREVRVEGGGRSDIYWVTVAPGVVRAEVVASGPMGARHRRLAWLRPDSVDLDDPRPGCPLASRLLPADTGWLTAHPEG